MSIVISVTVVTDDPEQAAKAAEVFSRAATGLVLDGISVMVGMSLAEDEEETETNGPE